MNISIRDALGPVLDWYQSDEGDRRNTLDIVEDVVFDLREDRAALLNVQRIAQDAKRMCEEGHPVSAYNLAAQVLEAMGVGTVRSPTHYKMEQSGE